MLRPTGLPELLPTKKPCLWWSSSASLRIPLWMSLFPPLLQSSFLGCWLIPQTKACPVLQKHAPLFHSGPKFPAKPWSLFTPSNKTRFLCSAQSPNFWVFTFHLVHRSSFSINQFMIQKNLSRNKQSKLPLCNIHCWLQQDVPQ